MNGTRKESDEVLYTTSDIVFVDKTSIQELKKLSLLNKRKRIRLCAHKSPDKNLHDMLIVLARDSYIRPHKHVSKEESITIIKGEADLILFEDDGLISQVVKMGDFYSGKDFFYRVSKPIYHMLIIRSDFLILHESTEGPFNREETVFPEWSPDEKSVNLSDFIDSIENNASNDFVSF
jgi:cupin fold WbuC family metalloprotein